VPRVEPTVRVLVVDDQPVARQFLRTVVESVDGFELVGELGDGESALELVGALAPELVLMDVRMPGLGGLETARRLAEDHPRVAVVLCSASPPLDDDPAEPPVLDKRLLDRDTLVAAWVRARRR
jgi:DNA-binding NarL/FixJ family response regulator